MRQQVPEDVIDRGAGLDVLEVIEHENEGPLQRFKVVGQGGFERTQEQVRWCPQQIHGGGTSLGKSRPQTGDDVGQEAARVAVLRVH